MNELFNFVCTHLVRYQAGNTYEAQATAGLKGGQLMTCCRGLAEGSVMINVDISLVQALETVSVSDVLTFLKQLNLKSGNAFHVILLTIHQPNLIRVVTHVGQRLPELFSRIAIGGPIVALDSVYKKWCPVLCADPRGAKFLEGYMDGPGWRAGTFFVAVPKDSAPATPP